MLSKHVSRALCLCNPQADASCGELRLFAIDLSIDAFFDALDDGWELASEDERFVAWWNLGDVAQGWVRR